VGRLVFRAALFVGLIKIGASKDWAKTVAETSAPEVSIPAAKIGKILPEYKVSAIKNDALRIVLLTNSVYLICILIGTKKGANALFW